MLSAHAIIFGGQLMRSRGIPFAVSSYRQGVQADSRNGVGQAAGAIEDGGQRRACKRRATREMFLTEAAQKHYHRAITLGAEYYHVIHRSLVKHMEDKARLTILIDPAKKKAFEELCSSQDMTSSQMVRQLIRQYLEKHGINYLQADKKRVARK